MRDRYLTLRTTSACHHLDANHLDVGRLRQLRDSLGLRFSAFDAHASLLLPAVGVPYLRRALDLALELDCPLVMSDRQ